MRGTTAARQLGCLLALPDNGVAAGTGLRQKQRREFFPLCQGCRLFTPTETFLPSLVDRNTPGVGGVCVCPWRGHNFECRNKRMCENYAWGLILQLPTPFVGIPAVTERALTGN